MGCPELGQYPRDNRRRAHRVSRGRDVTGGQPGHPGAVVTGRLPDAGYRVEQVLVIRHREPLMAVTLGRPAVVDNSPCWPVELDRATDRHAGSHSADLHRRARVRGLNDEVVTNGQLDVAGVREDQIAGTYLCG